VGRACAAPNDRACGYGRETLADLDSDQERAARPSDAHALRQVAAQVLGWRAHSFERRVLGPMT
jgi:hypothetical protein